MRNHPLCLKLRAGRQAGNGEGSWSRGSDGRTRVWGPGLRMGATGLGPQNQPHPQGPGKEHGPALPT